ncbi:MAG TPA: phenylalanine--tRNA ligase subunit alpha, partial [Clostridia bacterium]|nr:phenylalanine--tRNA ligase subunit alpha [Clostridia bacterium]
MRDELEQIANQAEEECRHIQSQKELDEIRIKYLGKKGILTGVLRGMGRLRQEERPKIGKFANEVKERLEDLL